MGATDNAQSGSGIPSNKMEGLEGFWGGIIIAIIIIVIIIAIFLCAYFYLKKQKQQNNHKTNICKDEYELLEKYRKLNDTDKTKIANILSSTNGNHTQDDEHKKE